VLYVFSPSEYIYLSPASATSTRKAHPEHDQPCILLLSFSEEGKLNHPEKEQDERATGSIFPSETLNLPLTPIYTFLAVSNPVPF
jgi:hypothetical protein